MWVCGTHAVRLTVTATMSGMPLCGSGEIHVGKHDSLIIVATQGEYWRNTAPRNFI